MGLNLGLRRGLVWGFSLGVASSASVSTTLGAGVPCLRVLQSELSAILHQRLEAQLAGVRLQVYTRGIDTIVWDAEPTRRFENNSFRAITDSAFQSMYTDSPAGNGYKVIYTASGDTAAEARATILRLIDDIRSQSFKTEVELKKEFSDAANQEVFSGIGALAGALTAIMSPRLRTAALLPTIYFGYRWHQGSRKVEDIRTRRSVLSNGPIENASFSLDQIVDRLNNSGTFRYEPLGFAWVEKDDRRNQNISVQIALSWDENRIPSLRIQMSRRALAAR